MRPWEIHPALVHYPIAFLTAAVVLDLVAWWRRRHDLLRAAAGLFVAGAATGALAALAGFLAFFTVPAHTHEAHALMYWHMGMNVVGLAIFGGLAWHRWRTRPGVPPNPVRLLGVFALGWLFLASWFGGDLVYRGGAGVDPAVLSHELHHEHS